MTKLHYHGKEEEPLMREVVNEINLLLVAANKRGLSLSGGVNSLVHALTMVLVMAYDDDDTRHRVASDIPDVVRAYIPQWERMIEQERQRQR